VPAADPCAWVAAVVAAVVFSVLSAASVLAVVVVATVLPGVLLFESVPQAARDRQAAKQAMRVHTFFIRFPPQICPTNA